MSVASGSGSVTSAVTVIVPTPRSTELTIWTAGGTLFTTIDVSAEVVFTPSDTETWIS